MFAIRFTINKNKSAKNKFKNKRKFKNALRKNMLSVYISFLNPAFYFSNNNTRV